MRSSSQPLLVACKTNCNSRGDEAVAPRFFNSLPPNIRSAQSLASLTTLLKMYLFNLAFSLRYPLVILYYAEFASSFFNHNVYMSAYLIVLLLFLCAEWA